MTTTASASQRFDIWAPDVSAITLLAGGSEYPMRQRGGGWWTAPAAPADGDVDYGYLPGTDTTPLPDPRSRRQPAGVHSLSRTFDPSAHEWADGNWPGRELQGAVIYELHIGTFTPEGTLEAAAGKLGYLKELGVDFVELLPVNGFNGTHNWGYDGVLWYTVHEGYGGPAAYQRFVDAAHAAGLGVIQDVVYNHLGPSGNYLPRFGPYLKSGEGNTWGDSVNLDGAGPTRSAATSSTTRPCGSGTTTWTGCGSTPCTPSRTSAPSISWRTSVHWAMPCPPKPAGRSA